jgi:sister chromatid cohesion protein PDS5
MASKNSTTLYGVNILNKFSKKGDLINYLNDLHKSLSLVGQEIADRPKNLKDTALQLVSPKLLSHNDKDVRVLTTCCIVDILRIFAPEAPYNNEDTISVFKAIVSQIRGLATYDAGSNILSSKVYYILNSIATVQSCVVPVILSQSGVFGADEVVSSMFDAILASVRVEHPDEGGYKVQVFDRFSHFERTLTL